MRRPKCRCGYRRTAAPTPPRAPIPTRWWRRQGLSGRAQQAHQQGRQAVEIRKPRTNPRRRLRAVSSLNLLTALRKKRCGIFHRHLVPHGTRNHFVRISFAQRAELELSVRGTPLQMLGTFQNEEDTMRGRVRSRVHCCSPDARRRRRRPTTGVAESPASINLTHQEACSS